MQSGNGRPIKPPMVKLEPLDPGEGEKPITAADIEEHYSRTNDRLTVLKDAMNKKSTYETSARELLEWCSDPRAYQEAYEENLVGCLTVIHRVSQKKGFDLGLGYRILSVCASQQEKFSPHIVSLLSFWAEDLGRQVLLRHQQKRGSAEAVGPDTADSKMHQTLPKAMPAALQSSDPGLPMGGGWQGGGGGASGAQQQLSVVTTVWGVATTTQTGGPTTMAPTGQATPVTTQQQQQKRPSYNQQQRPGQQYNNFNSNPQQMNSPMASNSMGSNNNSDFQSNSSALSAAALVAAAATATATATASVVAIQERQQQEASLGNQYNPNMPSQQFPSTAYNSHHQRMNANPANPHMPGVMGSHMPNNGMMSMPTNMNSAMGMNGPMNKTGMPMASHPTMYQGNGPAMVSQARSRASPYPNPHMAQKRPSQYGMMQHQYGGPGMQPYGNAGPPPPPQSYNSGQGCACCTGYPAAGPPTHYPKQGQYNPASMPPTPPYPSQQQMRSSLRPQAPPYGSQPPVPYYPQQCPPQTPPYDPHYAAQFNQQNMQQNMQQQRAMNYPMQIPGNPTPPLTPASVGPPYLSPTQDIKPNFSETKTPTTIKDEELRLTFPVRDGIILAPFRLEHNLAVSNHVFHLKPSVHQTLTWRSDLELQLKCFHHEDRGMSTNWPASVQVSVNATPLTIDRGDGKASHRPLHLKDVCQPGRNTIQITVTACCCSHLFLLQLVHRPTVRSVLQGLLRKRLLPADHCVSKIKRNFSSSTANPSGGSSAGVDDGVEQTAIKVSLKCPITFKRITLPARGQDCKHIQCFDLESYLQLNCERGAWRCPVCNKPALLEGLEVDQYIWGILTTLNSSEVEEVTIDGTASWKPVPLKAIKEEVDGAIANGPVPNGPMLPNGSGYGGGYEFQSQATDFSSPLSHLSENISSLDPLAAMEKSLNHHEQQMGLPSLHDPATSLRTPNPSIANQPHNAPNTPQSAHHGPNTPHTPHTPHTPGGPPSVPPEAAASQPGSQASTNSGDSASLAHAPDLGDLNFDPAAVIDGEGQGQEGLNLLPESVDPMDLLSYLDPPDLGSTGNLTSGTVTATTTSATSGSDDLLALFES